MDEEAPFWMVWNPHGHAPTHKHLKLDDANKEAERLARLNPGEAFHILEAKAMCKFAAVQWIKVDPSWVPMLNHDPPSFFWPWRFCTIGMRAGISPQR